MDVDMLLAEAEQEQHIYNEYAEDMEAELAMEAEVRFCTQCLRDCGLLASG